jgi:protein gp37
MFPNNVWVGVTAEDQQRADERIPDLLEIQAAVRFVSCEPLLDLVEVHRKVYQRVDWIIAGPETGPGARPTHEAWLRSLLSQCTIRNIPFFLKKGTLDGNEYHEFPRTRC